MSYNEETYENIFGHETEKVQDAAEEPLQPIKQVKQEQPKRCFRKWIIFFLIIIVVILFYIIYKKMSSKKTIIPIDLPQLSVVSPIPTDLNLFDGMKQ